MAEKLTIAIGDKLTVDLLKEIKFIPKSVIKI